MSSGIQSSTGEPLTTLKHTCGDAAETLDDISGWVAQYSSGYTKQNVVGCLITVEDNAIRFAWGTNPTQDGGTAVGHVLNASSSIKLSNHKQITDFRFINKVNGSDAVIQVTPEVSAR